MARDMMDIGLVSDDLAITAGDFDMIESTAEHQKEVILNNKGDFKQNPTICVGAFNYLDEDEPQNIIRAISVEFSRDGMDVNSVVLSAGIIKTTAVYK